MSQPSVCAVMLTVNRPEYARRAVECFRKQTYANKRLLVFDTRGTIEAYCGDDPIRGLRTGEGENESLLQDTGAFQKTIGELRNIATRSCNSDILIHWDDDDYSHPSRIAEQVALLQSSGADCVGYSDLLFWREPVSEFVTVNEDGDDVYDHKPGEAWLYTSPGPKPSPPGTTLCYWRKTWERNPFPATSVGEDERFVRTCGNVVCVPSIAQGVVVDGKEVLLRDPEPRLIMPGGNGEPRMIARIHPGNTSTAYDPRKMAAESKCKNPAWQRVAAWDEYCSGMMA